MRTMAIRWKMGRMYEQPPTPTEQIYRRQLSHSADEVEQSRQVRMSRVAKLKRWIEEQVDMQWIQVWIVHSEQATQSVRGQFRHRQPTAHPHSPRRRLSSPQSACQLCSLTTAA